MLFCLNSFGNDMKNLNGYVGQQIELNLKFFFEKNYVFNKIYFQFYLIEDQVGLCEEGYVRKWRIEFWLYFGY